MNPFGSGTGDKELNAEEREVLQDAYGHIQGVALGRTAWQHPGAPAYKSGEVYQPNDAEKAYMAQANEKLNSASLKGGIVGAGVPAVVFYTPGLKATSFMKNMKRPFYPCAIGGLLGYGFAKLSVYPHAIRQSVNL